MPEKPMNIILLAIVNTIVIPKNNNRRVLLKLIIF